MSWPELLKQVGLHIYLRRRILRQTQECLALEIYTDKTYVRRLERGQVNISLRLLFRVSCGLQITIYDLFANIEQHFFADIKNIIVFFWGLLLAG
jgi:DNA-binding XRE family transcriptional regulator